MIRLTPWILLSSIVLVALGLRLHGISDRSLWLDEALSWKLQSFPLSLMLQRTGEPTTTHPPLYFVMLHGWTQVFGDSETSMRSLSVLPGVLTIPAMFLLIMAMGRVFTPVGGDDRSGASERWTTAALLACLSLAVSNLHIYLSQQVRGYTLAGFFVVLSSLFLVRAVANRSSVSRDWIGYVVSAIALCYTHNLGLFTVAAQQTFVLLFVWGPCSQRGFLATPGLLKKQRITSVIALSVFVVCYLPWLTRSLGQSKKLQTSWQRPLRLDDIAIEISEALVGTSAQLQMGATIEAWLLLAGLIAVWGLLVWLGRWPGVFLFLIGAVPTGLIFLYSVYSQRSIFDARYLAFAQLGWLAGIAWLVSLVPYRVERLLLAMIPVTWAVFWCFDVQASRVAEQPGMRGAMAHVIAQRKLDEIVIAETPFVLFGAQYHARDHVAVRLCAAKKDRFAFNGESQLLAADLVTPAEIQAERPAGLWVLTSASYMSNAKQQFPVSCVEPDGSWELQETLAFEQDVYWEKQVVVKHYRRKPD